MKTKPTLKSLFTKSFIAVFILTLNFGLMAQNQNSSDVKDFKIKIEKTDNGIKMQSLKGSAWVDLSFSLPNDKPQTIDEYGMTTLDKVSSDKDVNLADFLFTITKTKNGIKLTGIEGTAWKELSFTLTKNGQQMIDQFGMTE
ncbi:hypothetical protein [Flavihumibacter fluvii]|uniref:hypothetical protein n=1 Tax=Flavihumibacter fluvii TaxID=2838157 RepID=UPI001BDDF9AB|nr:hypothetical protein [Flavihumibacter fluvii]ULQ51722.1 hypothetical protein KJS93_16670 [Flavihumibacter fluvii]